MLVTSEYVSLLCECLPAELALYRKFCRSEHFTVYQMDEIFLEVFMLLLFVST